MWVQNGDWKIARAGELPKSRFWEVLRQKNRAAGELPFKHCYVVYRTLCDFSLWVALPFIYMALRKRVNFAVPVITMKSR